MKKIKEKINSVLLQRKWKKANKHNYTYMNNRFPIDNVKVGNDTYGGLRVLISNPNYKLKLGHFCSIADDVTFVLSDEHVLNLLSTYPFKQKNGIASYEAVSKGNIIVEDDVWIGLGATIMSGVIVGKGAVIAAKSVVTKDVPAYSIVAGSPARVIRYRFNEHIIDILKNFDYSCLSKDKIKNCIDVLYTPIDDNNILNIIETLMNREEK